MNVICFSDLHITSTNSQQIFKCRQLVNKYQGDVVVISGDIFDNKEINPYKQLSKIYGKSSKNIPIICCLGNHQFAHSTIEQTLSFYEEKYKPDKYDVHYLDVIGKKTIGQINFVGNVLWYDGSLRDIGKNTLKIDESWLDCTIKNFNFIESNSECVEQINLNLDIQKDNFLVTHCVPHRDLNLFSLERWSIYNTYSGMNNVFEKLYAKIKYAVCGHTHRYVAKQIDECYCVNIGNDYLNYNKNGFKFFCFEQI